MEIPHLSDDEKLAQYEKRKKRENRKFLVLVITIVALGCLWIALEIFT